MARQVRSPLAAVTVGGVLTDIVLPTARVVMAVDALDPAYPSPPSPCIAPYIFGGGTGSTIQAQYVRNPESSGASFVVPGGTANLQRNAYGQRGRLLAAHQRHNSRRTRESTSRTARTR